MDSQRDLFREQDGEKKNVPWKKEGEEERKKKEEIEASRREEKREKDLREDEIPVYNSHDPRATNNHI